MPPLMVFRRCNGTDLLEACNESIANVGLGLGLGLSD